MADAGHMSGGKPVVPQPPQETLYTLEEAKAHLAQMECTMHGHNYTFITAGNHEPVSVFCEQCYKKWEVTPA